MKAHTAPTETTEQLATRYVDEVRRVGGVGAATETQDLLERRLREEGIHDEPWIGYIIRSLQPGGEQRILPGETRDAAVARLMRHFGWDERTTQFTISLSEGWSDLVPVDDDGNDLPYYRCTDLEEFS